MCQVAERRIVPKLLARVHMQGAGAPLLEASRRLLEPKRQRTDGRVGGRGGEGGGEEEGSVWSYPITSRTGSGDFEFIRCDPDLIWVESSTGAGREVRRGVVDAVLVSHDPGPGVHVTQRAKAGRPEHA